MHLVHCYASWRDLGYGCWTNYGVVIIEEPSQLLDELKSGTLPAQAHERLRLYVSILAGNSVSVSILYLLIYIGFDLVFVKIYIFILYIFVYEYITFK